MLNFSKIEKTCGNTVPLRERVSAWLTATDVFIGNGVTSLLLIAPRDLSVVWDNWVGLTIVVTVVLRIQHWNKTTHEVQFYITSLASDANKINSAIRQHWGLENSVYWTKYVTFREDESRILSLHSPQNFALLRLNALDREPSFRRSIRQKSRRAAMNDQYMVSVLAAALPNSSPLLESTCQ